MMKKLQGTFTLLVASFVCAQSQQTSPQPPVIRGGVTQVLVPVVVTDRHGHHVSGLKASDFQIFEDGQPQQILALSTDIGSAMPAAGASWPAAGAASIAHPGDPRMSYLFIVDTLHSSSANFGHVRDALTKFFEKEQSQGAQYALFALGRELKVLQDSTRDPNAVLASVRAKSFAGAILDSEANNQAAAAEQFASLMREYCSR